MVIASPKVADSSDLTLHLVRIRKMPSIASHLGKPPRDVFDFCLEHARAGYFQVSPQGEVVLDVTYLNVLGFREGEVPDDPAEWVAARVHPDDRRQAAAGMISAGQTESEAAEVEFRMRNAAGVYIWIRQRTQHRQGGEIVGVIQDVSEFRRSKEVGPISPCPQALVVPSDGHPADFCQQVFSDRDRAKARYEAVFNHGGIGVVIVSLDGVLVETNEAFRCMLGYETHELEGMHFSALTHPEYRERDVGITQQMARGERDLASLEKRYLRKNGEVVFAKTTVSLVRDPLEAPAYLIAMVHDVTDLAESRSRAEILYSSASVGIWDWIDVNGDRQYWTPRFYELLGYENGEIPATLENFRKALHPDDRERVFAMIEDHFTGKEAFELDYRLRCKSGTYRWFRGVGHAIFDRNGSPTRMVGTIDDIHDKKLGQEQLEALALRHRLSLKASRIGVWDWNVVDNDVVWDDQMYRLYGFAAEDWGGVALECWLAGLHPEDRAAQDVGVQEALAGRREFDTEFRVVWPSGEVRYLRGIADVLRDKDGTPVRMVGVNWDVTAERRRALAMGESSRALERSNDALTQSNEDLKNFAYVASHDLQTPLRSIAGFAHLLEKRFNHVLDDKGRDYTSRIVDGCAFMRRLIQDLLEYSRVDSKPAPFIRVDLNETCQSALEALEPSIHELKATIRRVTDLPVVRGDAVQLLQVFENLIGNALKYHGRGAPDIEISARYGEGQWRISVRDHGIGIAPEHHNQIFGVFARLHTAKEYPGTGIGLAICRRVVERHGGSISVESVEGRGSTFSFSLPPLEAGGPSLLDDHPRVRGLRG